MKVRKQVRRVDDRHCFHYSLSRCSANWRTERHDSYVTWDSIEISFVSNFIDCSVHNSLLCWIQAESLVWFKIYVVLQVQWLRV